MLFEYETGRRHIYLQSLRKTDTLGSRLPHTYSAN